jgi:hypothetical protein
MYVNSANTRAEGIESVMIRAVLAAWLVLFAHQGEELVIALPALMLAAAFFLMRYAAGGKSEDESPPEGDTPAPTSEEPAPEPESPLVGSAWR